MSTFVPRWSAADFVSPPGEETHKTSEKQSPEPRVGKGASKTSESQTLAATSTEGATSKTSESRTLAATSTEGATSKTSESRTPRAANESATGKASKSDPPAHQSAEGTSETRKSQMGSLIEDVLKMDLATFSQAGLIVSVWSEVLDQEILWVSDNVSYREVIKSGKVVYRAAELVKLADVELNEALICCVNEVKNLFDSTISSTADMAAPRGTS